ncbi:MAG: DUF177 domain-containing protein [Clostridiales bacterium]|nr:DUF177 domain-containing protein [Clostridiales bacterium]
MELNVADILKIAGKTGSARLTESVAGIDLSGKSIVLSEPVTVDASYIFDGEGISLTGTLSSAVRMNCTRCNDEFTEDFAVDFSERFLRIPEEQAEEQECYSFTGDTLSLDKMIQDILILNAPMYGVCKPDCKGLCPSCGANLNYQKCSCCEADDNSPFAALKGLKELLKDQ